jgi:hypothetical protein
MIILHNKASGTDFVWHPKDHRFLHANSSISYYIHTQYDAKYLTLPDKKTLDTVRKQLEATPNIDQLTLDDLQSQYPEYFI